MNHEEYVDAIPTSEWDRFARMLDVKASRQKPRHSALRPLNAHRPRHDFSDVRANLLKASAHRKEMKRRMEMLKKHAESQGVSVVELLRRNTLDSEVAVDSHYYEREGSFPWVTFLVLLVALGAFGWAMLACIFGTLWP